MAPLFEPQPDLVLDLLPRQAATASSPEIVLTVTRSTTIYTTTIGLGSGSQTEVPIQQSSLNSSPATTTTSAPQPIIQPTGEDTSRGTVAGAVIGSVLGFALLSWFLWKCRPYYSFWNHGNSSWSTRSHSSDSSYFSEMRHRGGGGADFEKKNRIRRPERARRHDRDRGRVASRYREEDVGFGERRAGGWMRERRSRSRVSGCLAGWFGAGPRRPGTSGGEWARRKRGSGRERSRSWSEPRDRKRRGSDAWNSSSGWRYKTGTVDD